MDEITFLICAILVGLSLAVYLRIFRRIYVLDDDKVTVDQFTRLDALLAFCLVAYIAVVCLRGMNANRVSVPPTVDTTLLIVLVIGQWFAVLGPIVLSFLIRGMQLSELFGLERMRFMYVLVWGLGLLLAALPLIAASDVVVSALLKVDSRTNSQEIVKIFESVRDPSKKVPIILLAIVVAPFAEELVFRGFLYGVFKKHFGALSALFSTSILFALIHLHLPSLLPLFILACILVLAYELTGTLLVPMVMHALFNTISLVAVLVASK